MTGDILFLINIHKFGVSSTQGSFKMCIQSIQSLIFATNILPLWVIRFFRQCVYDLGSRLQVTLVAQCCKTVKIHPFVSPNKNIFLLNFNQNYVSLFFSFILLSYNNSVPILILHDINILTQYGFSIGVPLVILGCQH